MKLIVASRARAGYAHVGSNMGNPSGNVKVIDSLAMHLARIMHQPAAVIADVAVL